MVNEVQRIPPAPRHVLWRRVLGYRWPLAAAAFALAIYGGVMTWMLFLSRAELATDDRRLDTEKPATIDTQLRNIEPAKPGLRWTDGSLVERLTYSFRYGGQDYDGASYAPIGRFKSGQPVRVQLLGGEPAKSRVEGTLSNLAWLPMDPAGWLYRVVVPGLVIGLCWLTGVFHLRHILTHGDVSVAQVLGVDRVRMCLPDCWSVRFRFRDHHARERTSRHWVRVHSGLGLRLLTMVRHDQMDRLPVLHDRRFPQYCRLVLPEDFSPNARPIDPAATIPL